MVKKYITWIAPSSEEAFTHTEVWVSKNAGVSFDEFTTANDPDYTANGILIADTDSVDLIGDSGYWYKIRFYDSTNGVWSDYSDPMRGSDFRGYCTITDVRNYTNVQSAEYSDAALQMMIDTTTSAINLNTGRTWQGVETETDAYFDGNGKNFMFVENDLISITSLAIDDTGDGTFTSISSAYIHTYLDRGSILLDDDAEVTIFPNRRRRVKITYTHGHADPTNDVRNLAILMVANMMKMDNTRTSVIEELKGGLRINSYVNTGVGACDGGSY